MTAKDASQINWDNSKDVTHTLFRLGIEADEAVDLYNKWANTYDKTLPADVYNCPYAMQAAMKELFPTNRDKVVVLDIGCGTGLTGQVLKDAGFTIVDGLDPAKEMLQKAEEKGLYQRLFNEPLTSKPIDVPADTYDAAVMVGVMTNGTITCDAFNEMVRFVKPGGYIVNCMRTAFLQNVPDYRDNFEPTVSRLEREGKWRVVSRKSYPNHYLGLEGECQIFQVL